MLDPVVIQGYPKGEDFEALDKLAVAIAEKHKTLDLQPRRERDERQ